MDWSKWFRWSRIIGGFSVVQILLQGVSALTGFIMVRQMSKEDYAWFTITSSLVATAGILTDSGLGSALSSLGGPIFSTKDRFAELLSVVKRYRRLFLLAALAVTLPTGALILEINKVPLFTSILLLLLVGISAVPAAETVMLTGACRLHSRLRAILVADASVASSRLVMTLGAILIGLNAAVAAGISAAVQWLNLTLMRRQTRDMTSAPFQPTGEFHQPMMAVVRQMLPICIFSCVQGHIATWILSFKGTTAAVADVGALARLGILVTIVALPLTNIAFPAIARASNQRHLAKMCSLTILAMLVAAAMFVGVGIFLWQPLLWIFGPQYGHLRMELAWYTVHLAGGLAAQTLWGICLSRSWVKTAWIYIPVTIVIQLLAVMLMDISSTTSAIQFAALGHVAGIVMALWLITKGVKGVSAA
jgi:O-antigen/teichoic acid export membrane protein